TPTEYLESIGVLGPNVVLAHSLGLVESEIECLARTETKVAMCPVTAAKGGRGVAQHGRMPELLAKGVKVALGCDSPNNSNHLDYNADGRSVHTVIIDGRVVVDAYQQSFVDEPKLYARVQAVGEQLLTRTGTSFPRSRWNIL